MYAVGTILGKLASFLMLPVYTRYLSPADYGVLELLGTTIDVIAMIAGIGLASGVFKFYADAETAEDRREVISTAALGSLGLALVSAVLGIALSGPLAMLVFGATGEPLFFRLFFATYFFGAATGVPLMLIRAQNRSTLFVLVSFAKLVAMLSLNIYLVVFRGQGVLGVLVSNLVVTSLLAAGLMAYLLRTVGASFSWSRFRRLSGFGGPIVLWSLGSFVLTFSDRYFLNYYTDAAAVGIYSLAYKFSFVLSAFAVAPFEQVWEPQRFAIAQQPDARQVYRRVFLYLNISLISGAVLVLLFAEDVLRIMAAPAFLPAYKLIPLLLVTTVLQQWTAYCNLGLYLKDATRLYAWAAGIGVVAALALNALLIPPFGLFGAAWATVGAYAIRFVAVYRFAQARYPIRYPWGRTTLLCALFGAVWFVRSMAEGVTPARSVGLSATLFAVVLGILYGQVLTQEDRSAVRATLQKFSLTRRVQTA